MTRQSSRLYLKPRVSMSDDGQFVYVSFADTNDTILKVGGHDGPGGWRDVERARAWVEAVSDALDAASSGISGEAEGEGE